MKILGSENISTQSSLKRFMSNTKKGLVRKNEKIETMIVREKIVIKSTDSLIIDSFLCKCNQLEIHS